MVPLSALQARSDFNRAASEADPRFDERREVEAEDPRAVRRRVLAPGTGSGSGGVSEGVGWQASRPSAGCAGLDVLELVPIAVEVVAVEPAAELPHKLAGGAPFTGAGALDGCVGKALHAVEIVRRRHVS